MKYILSCLVKPNKGEGEHKVVKINEAIGVGSKEAEGSVAKMSRKIAYNEEGSNAKSGSKLRYVLIILATATGLTALYLLSYFNYLFFHSMVELFSIVIAFAIFAIAWNSRRLIDNNYLLFIGVAYLFVGGIDLIHTLAYKGMGVFPDYGANLPTQLWIAARYMEGFSLLVALLFIRKKFRGGLVFVGYASITTLLFTSIFYWGNFPTTFVDGVGLTPFKIISEYVISGILFCSIILLLKNRREFDSNIVRLILAAMAVAIATEMAFTLYSDVYGIANMVGHLLKVVSFYFIYKALIETGITRPHNLLFYNLKQSEMNLAKHAEELTNINNRLEQEIAERKKVEAKLEEHKENLEKIVEERTRQLKDAERMATIGQIAGMVGHDIRNPLQAMVSSLHLTKTELDTLPDSEEKKRIANEIASIQEQTSYIGKIVNDLQDFSKPIKPTLIETDVNSLICNSLAAVVIPKNIEVTIQCDKQLLKLKVDPALFRRIFVNLVTNAAQAMPKGGELVVRSFKKDNKAYITVEDAGLGIPDEIKSKIFLPLFTTKAKGQGFGLAVVKRLVEVQGGTITFESEVGKGTTFTLEFPL